MNTIVEPEKRTIRVLMIEDDEDDYVITRDLLRQMRGDDVEMDWVSDPEEGMAVALERRHDVILIDYRLGRWSGLELIRAICETGCPTPLILLTGEGRANLDIEALQEGAADYLSKDEVNPSLLERSIRYAIERKRSGEALRESEERFRRLANAVPALIWMVGADDRFTFVNQSWVDFCGTRFDESIGKDRRGSIYPDDTDLIDQLDQTVAANSPFEVEMRMRRKDGEIRWMLNTGTPIFLADGTFNGYVGSCIDITERRLASEQLAETRDQALDNARLKSQFLANMTHEIRTPMNGILGMAGLLQQTNLTQEQRELTESVRSSGQSLVRIIDDILDFSRLEARRLNIDCAPFNLLSVIEDVIELLAESARAKGIELISSVDPHIALGLMGDSGRLRQVLLNLVGNAVKFTEEGGVVLAVGLEEEDDARITVRMEVRDTGIGIAKVTQGQLFTAFMQADGSTTRKYGGTGLGLAISKELVELMNGTITVDSELGQGSVFRIVLPLDRDPEGQQHFERGKPEWKGRKILIIDDNPQQRAVLCRHFTYLGFECVELARSSRAAHMMEREVRHNTPFAAVFMDADMCSEEAGCRIRHLADLPERVGTRIVAMPFGFLSEVLNPLRAAGADGFLSKPIRESQLHPLLTRLLAAPCPAMAKRDAQSDPISPFTRERFLLLGDSTEEMESLKRELQQLGGYSDLIVSARKAIEALRFFHYDAVFLDLHVVEEDVVDVLRQIQDLQIDDRKVPIPVIGLGAMESRPGMSSIINPPFERTKLLHALRRCRLLPELVREADSGEVVPESPVGGTPAVEVVEAEEFGADQMRLEEDAESLNLERLAEIRSVEADGENVIRDLLALFRQEVPHRIQELGRAVKEEDHSSFRFLIHAISGVCSNLGATRMEALCVHLRKSLHTASTISMEEMVAEIQREAVNVECALERAGESSSRAEDSGG